MSVAQRVLDRFAASKLTLGPLVLDQKATQSLRKLKLQAKSRGDIESAVKSAAFYAQKMGRTMYFYSGNSYGSGVWRVTDKASEYLSPINNTGDRLGSVTPELEVSWQDIHQP
jgi:hypothetical protein